MRITRNLTHSSVRKKKVLLALGILGLFASLVFYWWTRHPLLVVYVDPKLESLLDLEAYKAPLKDSGARRIKIIHALPTNNDELGSKEREFSIALELSEERNPRLDEEMLAAGLTGPGYTDKYTCLMYRTDIKLFIQKHRKIFQDRGLLDWQEIERRMYTNTAAHETWHALSQSVSHNPSDPNSLMYMFAGKSPLTYAWNRPMFTAGHKSRLQQLFAPRFP